ncbi:MAG: hypothetical protein Q9167_004025 [Letrouitia subvulpina]
MALPLSLVRRYGAGSHQKSLQFITTPLEKGFFFLFLMPLAPVAVAIKVSKPSSFFHCAKHPAFRALLAWPEGTAAGLGPTPVLVRPAPLGVILPVVRAEVMAREAALPCWKSLECMLSKVVIARAICTDCTTRSIGNGDGVTENEGAKFWREEVAFIFVWGRKMVEICVRVG